LTAASQQREKEEETAKLKEEGKSSVLQESEKGLVRAR